MYEAGGRLFVDVARGSGFAGEPRWPPGGHGERRSADRDALQTILERGDFIPSLPDEGPRAAPAGGAPPAPIETDPAIVTELIERSQASIAALKRDIQTKSGPALLDFILADIQELRRILFDPQSHQVFMTAMEASWWLNEQLRGVAGREERGGHAHAVRPPQRHVGDGAGAAGRRGRDPPASGCGGFSAARRGRGFPGRAAQARGRAGSARRHPGLARHVRHALRRRDRHHEAALERTPHHTRAHDPRQHQELRAGRRQAAFRAGAAGGLEEGTGAAGALAGLAGRGAEVRGGQADDRPGPNLHRVSRVPEVRHDQPLLRLQAGLAGRSRAPRAGPRAARAGRHLLPHVPGAPRGRAHASGG